MTIAINLKVNDGVVLATDSATSLVNAPIDGGPPTVTNVYNNANKILNLRKGLPIGLITWGSGSIGSASIATLAKDLRARLTRPTSDFKDWKLDKKKYQILEVATRVRDFFFEKLYNTAFAAWPNKPPLGFVIAGYSKNSDVPEEYSIQIDNNGNCLGPLLLRQPDEVGITWNGFPGH